LSVPVTIFVVQGVLLIFGWAFFAVTYDRVVPIKTSIVVSIYKSFQAILFVVGLIATAISLVSTGMCAQAIGYALTRRALRKPMLLTTWLTTLEVQNGGLVLEFKRFKWMVASLAFFIAVEMQGASWTTILTPKRVPVEFPINGYELDIASPAFQALMASNAADVSPATFQQVLPLVHQGGTTAVSARFSLPSILNFNQLSYLNSTHGIMPAIFHSNPDTSQSPNPTVIPPMTQIEGWNWQNQFKLEDFPVSFDMTQQGFTANVQCAARELNGSTTPSLELASQSDEVFGRAIYLSSMSLGCGEGVAANITTEPLLTSADNDAVLGASCPVIEVEGRQHWDIVLAGTGEYDFMGTTVCSLWPTSIMVNTSYNEAATFFNSSFPSFINASAPWNAADAPWVGQFTVDMFLSALALAQSTAGNTVGDTVAAFLDQVPAGNGTEADTVSRILEAYVRGVLEFSVTLLRTAYTASGNNLYPGPSSEIPENMRAAVTGLYKTETLGFQQEKGTAEGIFIPPTCVLLASIAIAALALAQSRSAVEPDEARDFDPANALHLMAAAAAGGLQYPATPREMEEYCSGVQVHLAPVADEAGVKKIGLMRVN